MFQGQVLARVGDFYRIAFPKIYREKFNEQIIITYGFESSLVATSVDKWEELFESEFNTKSFLSENVRDLKRIFLGGISYLDFDTQGRFIVPEYLRQYAGIKVKAEVIFVWQRNYIEIWDRLIWQERVNSTLKNLTKISEKLSGESVDE